MNMLESSRKSKKKTCLHTYVEQAALRQSGDACSVDSEWPRRDVIKR